MDSTEDPVQIINIKKKARRVYEMARVRLAIIGSIPLVVVTFMAGALSVRPDYTFGLGLIAVVAVLLMFCFGNEPQKAVFPGVTAGLIPLVFSLSAKHLHSCGIHGCMSWCLASCALGGLFAGYMTVKMGQRKTRGRSFWLFAPALTLLVGAMGCSCAGYVGVIGLVLGFVPSLTAFWMSKGIEQT